MWLSSMAESRWNPIHYLLLASVRTSMSVPLPIQDICKGSVRRLFRMQLGVPDMSVSLGIQLQLDCDCSVCRTCAAQQNISLLAKVLLRLQALGLFSCS